MITNKNNLYFYLKALLEALGLELLCDVISPSLPYQSDIPCFTIVIFHLDDYYWHPKFSSHTKFKLKTSN